MTEVFIVDTTQGLKSAVNQLLSNIGKSGPILKSSKEVYIKVNGIDFKKHAYTSPEVLEAVIEYLNNLGAKVYVMENSTQANMTRIVFAINGFKEVCKKTGAEIIYLDEEDTKTFDFKGEQTTLAILARQESIPYMTLISRYKSGDRDDDLVRKISEELRIVVTPFHR